MPDGPGKWSEQGVHVLSSLASVMETLEKQNEEIEALRKMVYKVAGFMVAAGVGGKAGLDWLVGLF